MEAEFSLAAPGREVRPLSPKSFKWDKYCSAAIRFIFHARWRSGLQHGGGCVVILVWKLATVTKCNASPLLIETYELERRRVDQKYGHAKTSAESIGNYLPTAGLTPRLNLVLTCAARPELSRHALPIGVQHPRNYLRRTLWHISCHRFQGARAIRSAGYLHTKHNARRPGTASMARPLDIPARPFWFRVYTGPASGRSFEEGGHHSGGQESGNGCICRRYRVGQAS